MEDSKRCECGHSKVAHKSGLGECCGIGPVRGRECYCLRYTSENRKVGDRDFRLSRSRES
jgi:hypothetical protein